jgi:dihydroorotase-like cyclic amidohydrolase
VQEILLEKVLDGEVTIIGTDHAPHPLECKDSSQPRSGIPGLLFWPRGIEMLRAMGINSEVLNELTFRHANQIFKMGLPEKIVEVEYRPELWASYGYNPFSRVDGTT